MMANLPSRFRSKITTKDQCWLWTASTVNGYGRYRHEGKTVAAHRLAYEILVGPIGAGLECDHLCRNRSCVNPAHLELVSHAENMLRKGLVVARGERLSIGDGSIRCAAGHLRAVTDRVYKSGRVCMECKRARDREYRRRRNMTLRAIEVSA